MKTGVQVLCKYMKYLDSVFRRNDKSEGFSTFYEFINFYLWIKMKEKPNIIKDKTYHFSLDIIRFYVELRKQGEYLILNFEF